MTTAQAQKSRVEDVSARTESSTRFANPDGTWTVEAAAGQVRARDAKGDWVSVDPSVVKTAEGFRPRRSEYDARFSKGGDRALAVVATEGGKTVGLRVESNLPAPAASGRELTYPNAADGNDLVVKSFAEGFNFSVVIKDRPQGIELSEDDAASSEQSDETHQSDESDQSEALATESVMSPAAEVVDVEQADEASPAPSTSPSASPTPSESPSPTPDTTDDAEPEPAPQPETTNEPTPQQDPEPTEEPAVATGGPTYSFGLDAAGLTADVSDEGTIVFKDGNKTVASMSQPVMWDSGAGEEHRIGKVDLDLSGGSLVLRPDAAFLADPDTTYPVTVDPSVVLNVASDTWVHSFLDTSSQINSPELRVGSNNLGVDKARSYLNFDVSSLPSGATVTDAKVNVSNFGTGSCAGTAITMTRITGSWSPGSITWGAQPAVTTTGQSSSTAAYGASGCATETNVAFDATAIVSAWVGGSANLGVRLAADNESANTGYRRYRSMENGAPEKIPALSVTYNSPPNVPTEQEQEVAPAVADGSGFLTAAAKPTFAAAVSDPDGGQVTAEFKLTKNGSTVESVPLSAVPSGTRVTRKPESNLTEGTYQAQWRVSDASLASAWSTAKTLVVDLTAPADPTVACTATTANAWYDTKPSSSTTCTITVGSGTGSIAAELNGVDAAFPTLSSGVTSKAFTLPDDGMFDLQVTAWDEAGNAATKAHTFGIGNGALTNPAAEARSVNRFSINASSRSGVSDATLQWRRVGDTTWNDATHVTKDGSAWTGSTVTQGSMSRTGILSWSAAEESGATAPSLVEARVCFDYSSDPQRCTTATKLVLVPHAFGGAFPTASVGPASVALQTGEFQLGGDDVDAGGLSLSRTYQSFDGPTSAAQSVFGPGWVANLDGPGTGLAGATVVDKTATDGTITLIVGGEATVYRHETGTTTAQAVGVYEAQGEGAALNERLEIVAGPPKVLVLTEEDGTTTSWNHISGTTWSVIAVNEPTADPASTYTHDANGLVTGMYDAPPGVTCNAGAQDRGCSALFLSYVTMSGSKRLDKVEARSWDPQPQADGSPGTGSMRTITVARYEYDGSGRLIKFWDPRFSTSSGPVETTYTYQSVGGQSFVKSMTPPGQKAWDFNINADGQLATVTREQASGTGLPATWRVVYDVPMSGANLPDMSATGIAAWKQPTAPAGATAIFGPDAPDASDWKFADLHYFSRTGLTTNVASYGAGDWQIDSIGYDARNNVVWDLRALARDKGLKANLTPWAISTQLSTNTAYSDDGTRVESVVGPVKYAVISGLGTTVRSLTEYVYDDEASAESVPVPGRPTPDPDMPNMNLVVEQRSSGFGGGQRLDMHKLRYRYDKVAGSDGDGWILGLPSRVSRDLDSGWSTTLTRFDTDGRLVETRTPQGVAANDGPGTDSRSVLMHYFTSDASSPIAACRNRPEWVDMTCQTTPAGGSAPVETVNGYDYLGNPTREIEAAGSMNRTVVTSRDDTGRPTKSELAVSGAASGDKTIADTTYSYHPSTGALVATTRGSSAVASTYDTWGRITSQTDGAGNTATTSYDGAGRVHTVNDGKGTATYTWDGHDSRGEIEHRGLLTKLDVGLLSGPDEITSAYDAGGNEIERRLPGDVVATWAYDYIGRPEAMLYARNGAKLTGELINYDAHNRIAAQQSGVTFRHYAYDGRSRLVKVEDDAFQFSGGCTTRSYSFSLDSNRTSLATAGPGAGGACTTANPATASSTFDDQDRITDTGYTYDALGRTRTLPAAHTLNPTGGAATVSYHANDMVGSISQGTTGSDYTLDPLDRVSVTSHTMSGDSLRESTDHYASSGDMPAWTETKTRPDGSSSWTTPRWTRWISGPDGGLAIESDANGSTLQLTNLHGDIVSKLPIDSTAGLANYQEFAEYGTVEASPYTPPAAAPYGHLGADMRSNDTGPGLTLMGARLYSPTSGRFLSRDSVAGGNDNAYVYPPDPINQRDSDGAKTTYWYNRDEGVYFELTDEALIHMGTGHNIWYYAALRTASYGYYFGQSKTKSRYAKDRRLYRYKYLEYERRENGTVYPTGNWVGIEMAVEWGYNRNLPLIITAYPISVNGHRPKRRNGKSWAPNWVRDNTAGGPRNYQKVYKAK